MSIIDRKKKPLATGILEQEIAEINLLLSEVGIRLHALGLRLVCSIEEQGYICPVTKVRCDDECCVSAEQCHIKEWENNNERRTL